jgi:hypothetical protein
MCYKTIRKQCDDASIPNDDGTCGLNHYLPCNGYKCPLVHLNRGTRPSALMDDAMRDGFKREILDNEPYEETL